MKALLKNLVHHVVFAVKELSVNLNGMDTDWGKEKPQGSVLLSLTALFFLPGPDSSLPSRVGGTDETVPRVAVTASIRMNI